MSGTCVHVEAAAPVAPVSEGCRRCLETGSRWVHLRLCTSCGEVSCCDSSPNRHATAHAHASGHPVVRSFEPGEAWWWCYPDELFVPEREGWPPARESEPPRA